MHVRKYITCSSVGIVFLIQSQFGLLELGWITYWKWIMILTVVNLALFVRLSTELQIGLLLMTNTLFRPANCFSALRTMAALSIVRKSVFFRMFYELNRVISTSLFYSSCCKMDKVRLNNNKPLVKTLLLWDGS